MKSRWFYASMLSLLLTACGGGGSDPQADSGGGARPPVTDSPADGGPSPSPENPQPPSSGGDDGGGGGAPAPEPTPDPEPQPDPAPEPQPPSSGGDGDGSGDSGGGGGSDTPSPAPTPEFHVDQEQTMAPAHGALIDGTTRLEVRGSGLENVELLPAYGYEPKLGIFTISSDKTFAYLDVSAEELPEGVFHARISAFNAAAGNATAREIIAMPTRQWETPLANDTPPSGPLTDIRFDKPTEIAADANGRIYVLDKEGSRIQQIETDGSTKVLIEREGIPGIAVSAGGEVFYNLQSIQDPAVESIYRIARDGSSVEVAIKDDDINTNGRITIDRNSGDLYFLHTPPVHMSTDVFTTANHVSHDGTVTKLFSLLGVHDDIAVYDGTVWVTLGHAKASGTDFYRWSGSGDPEHVKRLSSEAVMDIVATNEGIYFTQYHAGRFSDDTRCTVNFLDPENGNISHVAGDPSGACGYGEGSNEDAVFSHLRGITQASDGNLYVADTDNHVIRRVTPSGDVSLFAGVPGESGD